MADDAGLDAVLVQHCAHFVGRQVNVGLAVVAQHKAVAVAVAGNRAFKFGKQSGRGAGVGMGGFDRKSLRVGDSAFEYAAENFSRAVWKIVELMVHC